MGVFRIQGVHLRDLEVVAVVEGISGVSDGNLGNLGFRECSLAYSELLLLEGVCWTEDLECELQGAWTILVSKK